MHRSGRANWIVLALSAVGLGIVGLVVLGGESPETVGNRFLTALATGDVKTLTELSYFNPPREAARVQADWERTMGYSRYYRFAWRMRSSTTPAPDRANVQFDFIRDALAPNAYDERYSLDLVKVDGRWKVDVQAVNRQMFPSLPR